jgi:hypothetical protein
MLSVGGACVELAMFSKLKGVPSLSLRLVIWYAGASFLLLLLGSGSMYVELLRAYDSSDAQSISRKATTLRELVRQQDLPTLKWEIEIPGPGLG